MKDVEGVESVIVDTTGRAIIRTKEGTKPPEDAMNDALKKQSDALKVRKLAKTKLEAPVQIVQVRLDGFG